MFPDELAELLGGRNRFEAAIKADGCLNVFVSEEPSDSLIITGVVLQINRCRSVPKLMDCDPKTGRFLNALRDLFAKLEPTPRCTISTGKQ